MRPVKTTLILMLALLGACGGSSDPLLVPPPTPIPPPTNARLDLAAPSVGQGLFKADGGDSTGRFGVPVAAGFDLDGDGFEDLAMSAMQAAPAGRTGAGLVSVIFGDGTVMGGVDTAQPDTRVLEIWGAGPAEATGGEIWMDDVTGDGLGDLIIGRFNYRAASPDRPGAGALSVVVGSVVLRDLANNGLPLDLAAPPAGVNVLTLVGAAALDRLGFWLRTGDVSGDGVADLVVGADQADHNGENNSGLVYLVRGGLHLDMNLQIDLADFGNSVLAGQILRIEPPAGADDYHFGGTVSIADLDGNGRSEILIAAALSRVGGLLQADGAPPGSATRNGGNPGGSLFIVWDDNIPATDPWLPGIRVALDAAPGTVSRINGGSSGGLFASERFGEDLLGGEDYDADGFADLYVGDIKGDANGQIDAGLGHVLFSAGQLKGLIFGIEAPPPGIRVTTLLGASPNAISGDTSAHGDFDNDGIVDLAVASPLADPFGRTDAGMVHVLWGQAGPWPGLIDLREGQRPDPTAFLLTDVLGANGRNSSQDEGDTLMYSAAWGDLDADGHDDLVINEMRGNGRDPAALDVGNLLVLGGASIPKAP